MDESLTDAGFITELTPSDASKVDAYKDHSEKLLATPVTSPPQREYKQATKDAMKKGDFVVTESGFNFTVGFDAEPSVVPVLTPNRVPSFYAHFEIGKPIMFAYHVGGELFESPMFPSKLVSCNIGYRGANQFFVLKFEDGLVEISQNGAVFIFTYGDVKKPLVSTKKPENKDKIQSFIESKKMATLEEFIAFRCCSVDAMKEYAEAIDNASADAVSKMLKVNEESLFAKPQVKVYLNEDSFTSLSVPEDVLLPVKADFSKTDDLSSEEYILVSLSLDGAAFATDNYTGRTDGGGVLMETLIFPGDEDYLAPMGISKGSSVACGDDSPAGRVLSSIKFDESAGQVFMEFFDGTSYAFPDPEFGTFEAKDKETTQVLKGKVESIVKQQGEPSDELQSLITGREKRNMDKENILSEEGKSLVSSLAFITGEKRNYLKVIAGDKIITIPLGGEE